MKIVERTTFQGWTDYPVYMCRQEHYQEVLIWMRQSNVEEFLLQSGGICKWQVKSNHAWFILRWE